jgi:hypothetical protein
MRVGFAALLTGVVMAAAVAGCQSPAARGGGARGAVPELDEAAATAAGLSPQELSDGRRLSTGKCVRCHKFYDPAAYDDPKWRMWMRKMSRKAKLQPEEEEILSRYLGAFRLRRANQPAPGSPVP